MAEPVTPVNALGHPEVESEKNGNESPARPAAPRRATTTTKTGLIFRRPGVNPPDFSPPPLSWLAGTWYFTHSTLPIWKDKRNVRITYTIYDENAAKTNQKQQRLDDVVEYQEAGSDKVKQVRGREYTSPGSDTRAWDWRGKGIIKIASSHWEILGWADDSRRLVGATDGDVESRGNQWMVTYFIKTVFTPAALDFYCRVPDGLGEREVAGIKDALRELGDPELERLMGELYVCKHDSGPQGKIVDAKG